MQLKKPATTWSISGWTKEWEKENYKKDAVSKAMFANKHKDTMFANKYKDTMFDLPDTDNNTFCVGKNEIG